ncbi:MAG: MFS transporter [Chloroflexota bacterium]
MTSASPPVPRPSLVHHRDFVKLWSAETISQFGTQVSLLAIPLVAITFLQATPLEVGVLGAVEFLPFILFALPAGAWVDRLRRRPILVIGDLGRAVSLLSIPIAYELGSLTIWQLYVVAFVNGTLTVFFDVAYQSYLPALVERDQIVEGNSKLEISRSAAQIAGPGIAGLLIGAISAPLAIISDAISFLGSGLFILGIRKHEPSPDRHVDEHGRRRGSMREEIASGLRYVLQHPYLRSIAACTGWSNFFTNMLFAVYFIYVVRVFGLTPELIGIVFVVGNISTIVGALIASRLGQSFGLGRTIILSAFLTGPGMLLIAVAPANAPVPFLIASQLFIGFAQIVYNINQVSFRQAITPDSMQGRMNATMRFIVWGTIPLGAIVGGLVGNSVGVTETIWIAAIGGFFSFAPLLIGPLRTLREIPPDVAETTTRADRIDVVGVAIDESAEGLHLPPRPRTDES